MDITEIPLIGKYGQGKVALVDGDYDGEYFGQYRWYVNKHGYVVRSPFASEGRGTAYIYLHREVQSCPSGKVVDHINRNKLDNRSSNLRVATHSENSLNREYKASSCIKRNSGGRGKGNPRWTGNRWMLIMSSKYIGTYDTEAEAQRARDSRLEKHIKE